MAQPATRGNFLKHGPFLSEASPMQCRMSQRQGLQDSVDLAHSLLHLQAVRQCFRDMRCKAGVCWGSEEQGDLATATYTFACDVQLLQLTWFPGEAAESASQPCYHIYYYHKLQASVVFCQPCGLTPGYVRGELSSTSFASGACICKRYQVRIESHKKGSAAPRISAPTKRVPKTSSKIQDSCLRTPTRLLIHGPPRRR